jgi:hypothetical protein
MPISLTKYQDELDAFQAGQIVSLQDSVVKTRNAQQIIEFGRAVVVGATGGIDGKNIYKSKASLTYSADFIAINSTIVTVDGVDTSAVVYATSHAATFAALIAAIDALDGVSAAAGTGREILITVDGAVSNIIVSSATTGGGSQPTTTIAYTSVDVFEGVAALRHGQPTQIGADDKYQVNDAVNVLTRGVIAVEVVASVAFGDSVYVYNDKSNPSNQGQFTNSASGNLAVAGAKFVSAAAGSTSTPALAKIEFNLPA